MVRRSREPGLWALFSGGGMMAALFLPAAAALLWVAAPLGWVEVQGFQALTSSFFARALLFGFVALCLFHWAHRFRYTLYDGLQLYHLGPLIAAFTYGTATVLTALAAVILAVSG